MLMALSVFGILGYVIWKVTRSSSFTRRWGVGFAFALRVY